MRRIILTLTMALLLYGVSGQTDLNSDYSALKSSGPIPVDFLKISYNKYLDELSNLPETDKKRDRKNKQKFLLESNFYLTELLNSGDVLFGDPVTEYINKVADILLADQPELRGQLRFYLTRSHYLNAFSTDQGIIFVNIGLIAQIENEAQLAYTLAHEIVHYVKKHNMDIYMTEVSLSSRSQSFNVDYNDKLFALNFRSKESETEADKYGLEDYYLKTDYSEDAVLDFFDVMLYSYLPFDEVPFDTSFFNTNFFSFPDAYYLDTIKAIDASKQWTDNSGRHPSLDKRKELAVELLETSGGTGKNDFILPEEDFNLVRDICRFECIRRKMMQRQYTDVVYDCYLMLQIYPDNKFLKRSLGAALYSISRYRTQGKSLSFMPYYNKIQGESQQVYFFLNKLNKKELNALALRHCWIARKTDPKNEFLISACKDLASDLTKNELRANYFYKTIPALEPDADTVKLINDTTKQSKYDKINKQKNAPSSGTYFLKYIFADLFSDTAFGNLLTRAEKKKENDESVEYGNLTATGNWNDNQKNDPVLDIPIDKVVIADPYYLQYDSRKEGVVYYYNTDMKRNKLTEKIEDNAKRNKVDVSILNYRVFQENETERFNDLSLIKSWVNERFEHDDIWVAPFETDLLNSSMSKYETPYVTWMGMATARVHKGRRGFVNGLMLLIPYTLPLGVYGLATPRYYSYYFYITFDTRSGEVVLCGDSKIKEKLRADILNSKIYDTFYRMKKYGRKKKTIEK